MGRGSGSGGLALSTVGWDVLVRGAVLERGGERRLAVIFCYCPLRRSWGGRRIRAGDGSGRVSRRLAIRAQKRC